MNEREKITVMALEAQLAELRLENATLKIAAAKAENESLKQTIAEFESKRVAIP